MKFTAIILSIALTAANSLSAQEVTQHTSPDGHTFNFFHMPKSDRIAISVA